MALSCSLLYLIKNVFSNSLITPSKPFISKRLALDNFAIFAVIEVSKSYIFLSMYLLSIITILLSLFNFKT